MNHLQISNLSVATGETPIVRDLSLQANNGTVHAIMGPNGSGKSTFASALAGHPAYTVTAGTTSLNEVDLLTLDPEARAHAGLFLAFQYPASIPGVSVSQFLHLARKSTEKARGHPPIAFTPFIKELKAAMKVLHMPWTFAERSVNDGFSGGEKKRLEMLQMLILQPKLVILDEIDSGLDIDAMRFVAEAVHALKTKHPDTIFLVITHYQRLLRYIHPDHVHIMYEGTIIKSGDAALAEEIEQSGYTSFSHA